MKAVRIVYFADIRFPIERANGIQTMQTCWALAERGHEVMLVVRPDTAIVPRNPFTFYGVAPQARLRIASVTAWGPRAARRVAYLAQAAVRSAGRHRPDLIMTRDLGVAGLLTWLPRALRPAVVYESHGFAAEVARELPVLLSHAPRASPSKQQRLASRERRVWRRADGYVTITAALRSELTTQFGPRSGAAVVPDGVTLPKGRRFERGVRHEPPVVGYAGHVYPWKGVDVMLRALALLPDVRGLIVGGHPGERDLDQLGRLAADLGLERRVTFHGLVNPSSVAPLLAGTDVLVLPNTATSVSARYTSPLKLFEYLAAGKPIVASDLPSLREILREDENAVLATPGDPASLAGAIRRVLDDSDLAARLARQAFETAGEYSWDRRAERLERVFEAATAARRDRPDATTGEAS